MSSEIKIQEKVSVSEPVNEMHRKIVGDNGMTVFERYEARKPICTFGGSGVCCHLCSHGPCRITPNAPFGICGANADTIVARNWLRQTAMGAASYAYHLEEMINTLKAAARGSPVFRISDEKKLYEFAGKLGFKTAGVSPHSLALDLTDFLLAELRKGSDEPSRVAMAFAPGKRIEVWKKLGILGGGLNSEIRDNLVRTATSINSDAVDLLLKAMKMAISTNYVCLSIEMLHDIVFGTPSIVKTRADLGIIDRDTVNIIAHGHEPMMGMAVIKVSKYPEMIELARSAGAKGIKVYGSMDTGQELIQRAGVAAEGVEGQLGNWASQEFILATGAIDLVMADMNCTLPVMGEYVAKYGGKIVPVSGLVRTQSNGSAPVEFNASAAEEQAKEIIRQAVESYRSRKSVTIPTGCSDAVVGFSLESITGALGGSVAPLLDVIKNGSIKGIVAVVGCTNCKNGQGKTSTKLVEELVKKDILVVSAGCVSSDFQSAGFCDPSFADKAGDGLKAVCKSLGIPPVLNFGTCTDISRIYLVVTAIAEALGVDVPDLPVAASAPEYLEQKAVVYGTYAVAGGLFTHVGPIPPVTGSPLVTKVLTEVVEDLTGGKVNVEQDPVKAADAIYGHIMSKRQKLGI
ncbi:carbon-monoxide dehydrogenase catalytic subunit [Methanocella sp. CWC-04]|uniref:Carbon monoxide dehydrogenase n=1 Tax=Methanooceanicella nereidis TaxID=2052831 RepID=A0AAP2W5G0_9EURY|nr:anaerobic carbon-monoxide dehydrogenase catalytic subunit [Methanocella sp. CWC-04]MCD1294268.1 carbon-monoxide dehydrogenase catalytic subunit [Methanocella sp. CWC-04]